MSILRLLIIPLLAGLVTPANAQFSTVNFDYELSTFNDNQPLPAETAMIITGPIPEEIAMVEVSIYTFKGNDERPPLYTSLWKRPYNKPRGEFRVPVNYKLPSSSKYDLKISYFRMIREQQRELLYQKLTSSLDAYIDQIFEIGKNRLEMNKGSRHALADMNELVTTALSEYRMQSGNRFDGFSDIIREQLENLRNKNLSDIQRDTTQAVNKKSLLKELKELTHSEVDYLLNDDLALVVDSRYVEDYETEDKAGYFSINVGYGAVYLGGNINNLDYGTAPYVSLGFPLSTSRIAPAFLRNASLTIGVFTTNFDNEDKKVTGPIIKRPIQFGIDYKLFHFIRFNAGAALLEEEGDDNGSTTGGTGSNRRVFFQPFVGLSAKINLQLTFDR